MKVTVCFGAVRVIVPCPNVNMLVRDLIHEATTRYRKAAGKGQDSWVVVHKLKSQSDGGILDPDDKLVDVADDREQIMAIYEEDADGMPSLQHNAGDGTSASSVGTNSPDIFQTNEHKFQPFARTDIEITGEELSGGVGSGGSPSGGSLALQVRRGSEPALNRLSPVQLSPPDPSKRWSAAPIIDDDGNDPIDHNNEDYSSRKNHDTLVNSSGGSSSQCDSVLVKNSAGIGGASGPGAGADGGNENNNNNNKNLNSTSSLSVSSVLSRTLNSSSNQNNNNNNNNHSQTIVVNNSGSGSGHSISVNSKSISNLRNSPMAVHHSSGNFHPNSNNANNNNSVNGGSVNSYSSLNQIQTQHQASSASTYSSSTSVHQQQQQKQQQQQQQSSSSSSSNSNSNFNTIIASSNSSTSTSSTSQNNSTTTTTTNGTVGIGNNVNFSLPRSASAGSATLLSGNSNSNSNSGSSSQNQNQNQQSTTQASLLVLNGGSKSNSHIHSSLNSQQQQQQSHSHSSSSSNSNPPSRFNRDQNRLSMQIMNDGGARWADAADRALWLSLRKEPLGANASPEDQSPIMDASTSNSTLSHMPNSNSHFHHPSIIPGLYNSISNTNHHHQQQQQQQHQPIFPPQQNSIHHSNNGMDSFPVYHRDREHLMMGGPSANNNNQNSNNNSNNSNNHHNKAPHSLGMLMLSTTEEQETEFELIDGDFIDEDEAFNHDVDVDADLNNEIDFRLKGPTPGSGSGSGPVPPSTGTGSTGGNNSDEVVVVLILRYEAGPLGIHLVPEHLANAKNQGLIIQTVEPGGRIDRDGRLQAGDKIIEINRNSLLGVPFQRAHQLFRDGLNSELELKVVKSNSNSSSGSLSSTNLNIIPNSNGKSNSENLSSIMEHMIKIKQQQQQQQQQQNQNSAQSVHIIRDQVLNSNTVINSASSDMVKSQGLSSDYQQIQIQQSSVSVVSVHNLVQKFSTAESGGVGVLSGGSAPVPLPLPLPGSGEEKENMVQSHEKIVGDAKVATVSPTKKLHTTVQAVPLLTRPSSTTATLITSNTRKIGRKYEIDLQKGPQGLGFSITTRDNPAGGNCPIYIKNILPQGAAIDDGRLRPGDRLLEVNGIEITGKSQSEAVSILRNVPQGGIVKLVVSRQERVDLSPKLPRQIPPEKVEDDVQPFPWSEREVVSLDIPVLDTEKAGLGISVKGKTTAAQRGNMIDMGIYIKSVIHGGAASRDGRLKSNDQLLSINGVSLLDRSNTDAMETLRKTMTQDGPKPKPGFITLSIARRVPSSSAPTTDISGCGSSASGDEMDSWGTRNVSVSVDGNRFVEPLQLQNQNHNKNYASHAHVLEASQSENTAIFLPAYQHNSNQIPNHNPNQSSQQQQQGHPGQSQGQASVNNNNSNSQQQQQQLQQYNLNQQNLTHNSNRNNSFRSANHGDHDGSMGEDPRGQLQLQLQQQQHQQQQQQLRESSLSPAIPIGKMSVDLPRNPVLDRLQGKSSNHAVRNESYYRATNETWNSTLIQSIISGRGQNQRTDGGNPVIRDRAGLHQQQLQQQQQQQQQSMTVENAKGEMILVEDDYVAPQKPPRRSRSSTPDDTLNSSQNGKPVASEPATPTQETPALFPDATYASQTSLDDSGGFSRDAFGRQSMSEKRHATLDAKSTDTYQRNKKLREERERQRQLQIQQEQMNDKRQEALARERNLQDELARRGTKRPFSSSTEDDLGVGRIGHLGGGTVPVPGDRDSIIGNYGHAHGIGAGSGATSRGGGSGDNKVGDGDYFDGLTLTSLGSSASQRKGNQNNLNDSLYSHAGVMTLGHSPDCEHVRQQQQQQQQQGHGGDQRSPHQQHQEGHDNSGLQLRRKSFGGQLIELLQQWGQRHQTHRSEGNVVLQRVNSADSLVEMKSQLKLQQGSHHHHHHNHQNHSNTNHNHNQGSSHGRPSPHHLQQQQQHPHGPPSGGGGGGIHHVGFQIADGSEGSFKGSKRDMRDIGPSLGMKKSSSLESLQTMVQEIQIQEDVKSGYGPARAGPAAVRVVRGRGCNESFRQAVDRSYEAPLGELGSQMETLAEEETESCISGVTYAQSTRLPYASEPSESEIDGLYGKTKGVAKKKQGLFRGLGSMFRFGRHRKSTGSGSGTLSAAGLRKQQAEMERQEREEMEEIQKEKARKAAYSEEMRIQEQYRRLVENQQQQQGGPHGNSTYGITVSIASTNSAANNGNYALHPPQQQVQQNPNRESSSNYGSTGRAGGGGGGGAGSSSFRPHHQFRKSMENGAIRDRERERAERLEQREQAERDRDLNGNHFQNQQNPQNPNHLRSASYDVYNEMTRPGSRVGFVDPKKYSHYINYEEIRHHLNDEKPVSGNKLSEEQLRQMRNTVIEQRKKAILESRRHQQHYHSQRRENPRGRQERPVSNFYEYESVQAAMHPQHGTSQGQGQTQGQPSNSQSHGHGPPGHIPGQGSGSGQGGHHNQNQNQNQHTHPLPKQKQQQQQQQQQQQLQQQQLLASPVYVVNGFAPAPNNNNGVTLPSPSVLPLFHQRSPPSQFQAQSLQIGGGGGHGGQGSTSRQQLQPPPPPSQTQQQQQQHQYGTSLTLQHHSSQPKFSQSQQQKPNSLPRRTQKDLIMSAQQHQQLLSATSHRHPSNQQQQQQQSHHSHHDQLSGGGTGSGRYKAPPGQGQGQIQGQLKSGSQSQGISSQAIRSLAPPQSSTSASSVSVSRGLLPSGGSSSSNYHNHNHPLPHRTHAHPGVSVTLGSKV